MARMVAAARRLEEAGKPDEAKLLRDVASTAITTGVADALKLLESSRAAKPKPEDVLAEVQLAEQKLVFKVQALDPNENEFRSRAAELAGRLLDVAELYRKGGAKEDAARLAMGAELLGRVDRVGAMAVLAERGEAKTAIAAARAKEKRAAEDMAQIAAALSKPSAKDMWGSIQELIEAGAEYESLGLREDASRVREAAAEAAFDNVPDALRTLRHKENE
jgi:hypothetical protein